MNGSPNNPTVFFEAEWTYRTWRGFLVAVVSGVLGGAAIFIAVRGLLYEQDIWQHYDWLVALCVCAFGIFCGFIGTLFFVRIVAGTRETSQIGTDGVKIGRKHWGWDQMRFVRPQRDSTGGVIILIALKQKCDRYFWAGRPLRQEEFEKLSQQLLPFLQSKYPHLIEH